MTENLKQQTKFQQHQSDFDYCEKIIKKHSKTFYAAFSSLPKIEAMSVYAIYAFCRKADDLVDEHADGIGLDKLWKELTLFENGKEVDHPVWRALRVVFDTYEMDITPFYEMIIGQQMDLAFNQPETQKDLETYSHYVAGTVGLMLLPLLTDNPNRAKEEAIALGIAMQITNILRDVGEDIENGRIYLPKEAMDRYDYSIEELQKKVRNRNFIDLWEYEAQEAEKYYEQALNLIDKMRAPAKKPLYLSIVYYKEILEAVRLNDYNCFTQKSVVSKQRKIQLLNHVRNMVR